MKTGKIEKVLRKSPINYFSDLFIVAMVLGWIVVLFIMVVVAIYVTLVNGDTSMWSDIANLVAIPLSCGGAIWMIKNSVQHAIANNRGERAHMDFPKVNADGEADGNEEMVNTENKTESEETVG
jgi:hypothetical protein